MPRRSPKQDVTGIALSASAMPAIVLPERIKRFRAANCPDNDDPSSVLMAFFLATYDVGKGAVLEAFPLEEAFALRRIPCEDLLVYCEAKGYQPEDELDAVVWGIGNAIRELQADIRAFTAQGPANLAAQPSSSEAGVEA